MVYTDFLRRTEKLLGLLAFLKYVGSNKTASFKNEHELPNNCKLIVSVQYSMDGIHNVNVYVKAGALNMGEDPIHLCGHAGGHIYEPRLNRLMGREIRERLRTALTEGLKEFEAESVLIADKVKTALQS